jgi:hypothetical protein
MILVYAASPRDSLYCFVHFILEKDIVLFNNNFPDDFNGRVVVIDGNNHIGNKYQLAELMGIEAESITDVLHVVRTESVANNELKLNWKNVFVANWQSREELSNVINEFRSNNGKETI